MQARYAEAIRDLGRECDQVIKRLPTQAMRDQAFAVFQKLAIVITMLAEDANRK